MSEIKTVSVVGAPHILTGEKKRGGGQQTRKKKGHIGGDNSGAMMQVAANHVPSTQAIIAVKGVGVPATPGIQGAPLQEAWGPIKGGSVAVVAPVATPVAMPVATPEVVNEKKITVELRKNKQAKNVMLNPKKQANISQGGGSSSATSKHSTRKNRKITLGVVSLHKRVTRAKKIREKVKEMPIAELRAELVKRGLIRQNSKAPESVLRQIAADAQIVGGKGL